MRKPELLFDVDFLQHESLNSTYACAFLSVGPRSLTRLREAGAISAFAVEGRIPGKCAWRYRLVDLHRFVEERRIRVDVADRELSPAVIARLLGVEIDTVYLQKHRGSLRDYTADSVRRYMLAVARRRLAKEERTKVQKDLMRLRGEVRRFRRVLRSHRCEPAHETE